jgi:DNA (cytosine-5)-methyltransferase 1
MLKQLDLCSGVGAGFPLAGVQLGLELIGLCELDQYCRGILKKRFPGVTRFQDVKQYDWRFYTSRFKDKPDVLTTSPPCQPFSVRGKRLAADDERDCFPAVLRAIAVLYPDYIAIENVRGLLSCPYRPGDDRSYFGFLLEKLSEFGYDAEWICLSSGRFASPFLRERLLLVAVSHRVKLDWQRAASWDYYLREQAKADGSNFPRGVPKTGGAGEFLRSAYGVDGSIGTKVGNGINRQRRAALGNCLDPRIARIALERVLYLDGLRA